MKCSICGTVNSARVKFCSECGSPIGIPCPSCGFRNAQDAAACGGCGRSFDSAYVPLSERRQLTVFFSDMVGSTTLAESLDPEDLQEIYARYQAICGEAIRQYDGYLAQYLGDGVLAYFGYPAAHEDDAGRAVRAALEILRKASSIETGSDRPRLRIGIHTGLVVVGNVGSGERSEQLALGEAPNIAARLQSEAQPDTIVISDATRNLLAGQFALDDLGSRTLKGISRPMQIFRVLGESGAVSRFHAMKSAQGLTPFVGREREVKAIRAAWAEAATGHGRILLLRGEAGMGKSRLLETTGQIAASQLHEVFQAQCSPYRMNSPLHPIVEIVERRLGLEDGMPANNKLDLIEQFTAGRGVTVEVAAAALAELLSVPTLGRYPEIDLPPARRLQLTIRVMADLLLHSVSGAPVLLLIEDLHWADPSTHDLLGEMVGRLADLPVLMVCTTRPNFSAAWIGHPQCSEIGVEALSTDDTRALVARIAGPKQLPLALVHEVAARTGGIPLFTEAVTRTVMSSGVLRELEDRFELTGPLPSGLIPATVQDSLMARIDRLGADRPVAQLAATIGRESSFELIQAVLRTPAASLTAALHRMVELELVSEEGTPPAATYTFRHALIQDAAYESLLRKTRQEFHGKIAEALVRQYPEIAETKPELLARHHEGAGRIAEATEGWVKAGRQARQRLALRECEAHLRKAISLLATLPEDDVQRMQTEMEVQLSLGQALTETYGWASRDLETAFQRARDLCIRLNNPIGLFFALNGLSAVHLLRGELRKALETAKPVHEMAEVSGVPVQIISACSLNMYPAWYMADYRSGLRYAEQGLALYTPEREREIMGLIHLPCSFACAQTRAGCLWTLGYPDKAARQEQEGQAMIEALNIGAATTLALGYYLHWHFLLRDPAAVDAIADQAYQRAADEGFLFWSSQARVFRGWAQAMRGDTDAGIADIKAALEIYSLSGARNNGNIFFEMLAEALRKAGRLEEALQALSEGLDHVAKTEERVQEPELHRLQGEILLQMGDMVEGEASLRRAVEVARQHEAKMFEARAAVPLARLLRSSGRIPQMLELLRPLDEWFQEGRNTPELMEIRVLLDSAGALMQPADLKSTSA
ncbi:MAG TPA: adenylate/guanylate cyclase domain-containing protein [Terracidiphilus sp.]|nr:adenylate/guanylate cyclase domain-containing protein [Terracidiphilus sp.]